jgi:phosphoglucomutase
VEAADRTDHARHGIVTRSTGLLPPNPYLSVAIFYLFQHRPKWGEKAAVGKTVVSSQMIDRVTAKVGRKLAAEITARMGRDPGEVYHELTREFGEPVYDLVEASATTEEKERLERLSPQQVRSADLAGEKTQAILTRAPGNGAPIGGLKVIAESGWFAARPSGTEDIYKIYAESFRGADHLRRILEEAQAMVNDTLAVTPDRNGKS